MTDIGIGTSAFTAEGWVGSFYPEGPQPRDFLNHFATKFNTVVRKGNSSKRVACSQIKQMPDDSAIYC
jgi:hypothetical protein